MTKKQQQQQRKRQEENGEKFERFSLIFSSIDVNSKIISKGSAIQKQVKKQRQKEKERRFGVIGIRMLADKLSKK